MGSEMCIRDRLEALPVDIKDKVLLQLGENDVTYSQILETAKKIWPHRWNRGSSFAAVNIQDAGATACASVQCHEPEVSVHESRPITSQNNQKPFVPRCRGCKRLGHLQRDCRIICHRCNEKGHMKFDCPSLLATAVPLNAEEGVTKSSVTPKKAM